MTSLPSTRTSYMAKREGEVPEDDPLLDFAPVPHKAPRRNSIGPDRQRKFIAVLAASGVVKEAALQIGASLEALYKLRQRPGAEGFRAAWDLAVDRGMARLESAALTRAIEGEERLVVSGGKLIGTERRHNDNLVMFLLRNRRPERYGAAAQADFRPGHPVYEKIRREIAAAEEEEAEAVLDSIDQYLEDMRQRRAANTLILEGPADAAPDANDA